MMATFNQSNQNVHGNQYNDNSGTQSSNLAAMIADLRRAIETGTVEAHATQLILRIDALEQRLRDAGLPID